MFCWAGCSSTLEDLQDALLSDGFFGLLQEVQEVHGDLICNSVIVIRDFGLTRSLCCGATTWATECGVADTDID